MASDVVYASDKSGCDSSGQGTREKPYKTVLQALRHTKGQPNIWVDNVAESKTPEDDDFVPIAKSSLKKWQKVYNNELKKEEKKSNREEEDALRRYW